MALDKLRIITPGIEKFPRTRESANHLTNTVA
jgi:hypothetical protein